MSQSIVSNYVIDGPTNAVANDSFNHDRGRSPPFSQSRQGGKLSRRPTDGHSSTQGMLPSFLRRRPVAHPVPSQQQQLSSRYNTSDERLFRQDRSAGEVQLNNMQTTNSTDPRNRPFPQAMANHDHGPSGVAASPQVSRQGLWSFVEQLPQPADDQTIQMAAQQVFSLADQYVDNFYVNRLHQSIRMDAKFDQLRFPNLLPGSVPAVVIQLVTDPTVVIKHCLVYVLLSCIAFDNDGQQLPSLLPHEFTALARALRGHEVPVKHYSALSAYRVLLSFLRPGLFQDGSYQTLLGRSFGRIWDLFEVTFQPWLDPQRTEDEREPSFDALLQKTVQLGITLFSHPCTFNFNWDLKADRDLEIVIAPRLLKINDEAARELKPSQLMLQITTYRTSLIEGGESQSYALPNTQAFHNQVTHSRPIQNSAQLVTAANDSPYYTPNREIFQHDPMTVYAAREPPCQSSGQERPATHDIHELPSDSQERPELEAANFNPRHINHSAAPSLPPHSMEPPLDTSFLVEHPLPRGNEHGRNNASSQSHIYTNQVLQPSDSVLYAPPEQFFSSQAKKTFDGSFDRRVEERRYPPTASANQFPNPVSQPVRRRSSHEHRSASEDRGRRNSVNPAPQNRRASISSDRTGLEQFADRPVTALERPKHSGGIPDGILPPDRMPRRGPGSGPGQPRQSYESPAPDRMSRPGHGPGRGQPRQPNEAEEHPVTNLTTQRSDSGMGPHPGDHEQRHSSRSRQGFGDRTLRNDRPEKKRDYLLKKLRNLA